MSATGHREPYEARVSRTDLGAPGGETPLGDSTARLFSFISMNWRAKPLVSYRVIIDLIGATTTKTGLTVRCELDSKTYPKGIVVSDAEMTAINMIRNEFHGEWNYTIQPSNRSDRAVNSCRSLSRR